MLFKTIIKTRSHSNLWRSIFCFFFLASLHFNLKLRSSSSLTGKLFLAHSSWTKWKKSTCRVQVAQSSPWVYASIWFGFVWCALGTANASTVAGGLECAQKLSASAQGRPQSKDCVKFNSRWTLPESSASGLSPSLTALNYKIAGSPSLLTVTTRLNNKWCSMSRAVGGYWSFSSSKK